MDNPQRQGGRSHGKSETVRLKEIQDPDLDLNKVCISIERNSKGGHKGAEDS